MGSCESKNEKLMFFDIANARSKIRSAEVFVELQ